MRLIERKEYMECLRRWCGRQVIKVIMGVRRCGKSVLLRMYEEWLLSEGVSPERVVYVSLEDYDNRALRDGDALHAYLTSRLSADEMTYFLLDEIQLCPRFSEVVASLFMRPKVDVVMTGSNAQLLSGELATMLSGRYVEIRMLPLSFREYVEMRGGGEPARLYRDYVGTSSFPYAVELTGMREELDVYLDGLYNTIVVKDILERRRVSEVMVLRSVTEFVFGSVGSELSTRRIAGFLTSSGRKTDAKTVERYLSCLLESFMIYRAERYDVRGKQVLQNLVKYYVVDVGLRQHVLSNRNQDVGHILENVVYLELLRRGCKVYVGQSQDIEIDFVAESSTGRTYYQVAATVRDPQTLARELEPFRRVRDHYPRVLLTLDEDPDADFEGIRKINALDWLLAESI